MVAVFAGVVHARQQGAVGHSSEDMPWQAMREFLQPAQAVGYDGAGLSTGRPRRSSALGEAR